jgi:CHAT domain
VRVFLDLIEEDGEHSVVITAPGRPAFEPRPVRWTAGQRLLVAKDEQLGDAEAAELASSVDASGARAADLERYGKLLFDAAFGGQTWRQLVADTAAEPYLELAIRGPAESPSLHALRWEALYDGATAVAARGTVIEPGSPGLLPVGIVRLVPSALPLIQNVPGRLSSVNRIPRVLYAIGSRLTDPRVRAGAEFMGILRHLERKGGSIQPRVLQSASAESLTRELEHFQPDVLHVIGHGHLFPEEHCVKLQLRAESPGGGDDWLTAGQLLDVFAAANHTPKVVVLSACQTASAPADGAQDSPVNSLPFAARLVAGGVPIVVAMAGDISDTACRVFTRALTQAIGEGVLIADAVIRGRQAAFRARPDLESADWALPAVFLAEQLPPGIRLVDTAPINAMRQRIFDLNLGWDPVFCGRGEFVDAMDRLLDGSDPLNVLVAYTQDPAKSYGGLRLLQELAARAVRAGCFPVLLGPYDQDPPPNRARFAADLSDKLADIRANLGLRQKEDRIVAVAESGAKPLHLVAAIREALEELIAELPATDPVAAAPQPRVVLLCHRADRWVDDIDHLDALDDLLGMLGQRGLTPGAYPVPVVLTGADTGALATWRQEKRGAAWAKFLPLARFRDGDDDPEDILAYQVWLLNPPTGIPVYAPKRGADPGWQDQLRWVMSNAKSIYDEAQLFGFAKASRVFFTADMDADILNGYDKAAKAAR